MKKIQNPFAWIVLAVAGVVIALTVVELQDITRGEHSMFASTLLAAIVSILGTIGFGGCIAALVWSTKHNTHAEPQKTSPSLPEKETRFHYPCRCGYSTGHDGIELDYDKTPPPELIDRLIRGGFHFSKDRNLFYLKLDKRPKTTNSKPADEGTAVQ